ncbi:hypothetical protein [Nocardia sp. CA-135398]|uniref:hypothetical protein n=1 Tax=Nocardia sp. CA-135398 TaxID=3239977 RepID=UPI003D95AF4A
MGSGKTQRGWIGGGDGGCRGEQTVRIGFGQFAEAGGFVDRIADDGEFVASVRTDIARDDTARDDADSCGEIGGLGGRAVSDGAGTGQGGARRVAERGRCAEDGERGAALELVEQAAAPFDLVDHDRRR